MLLKIIVGNFSVSEAKTQSAALVLAFLILY